MQSLVARDLASLGPSVFPHQEVEGGLLSLTHWADTIQVDTGHWTLVELIDQISLIQANFSHHFWVGSKQGAEVEPQPHLVNRTQMYKVTTSNIATTPQRSLSGQRREQRGLP